MEAQLPEAKVGKGRYEQLLLSDEKRLKALYHVQGYQRRMARAFNKRVKPRNLKEGDLVLKEFRAPYSILEGKFKPNWAGPYVIKTIMTGGAVKANGPRWRRAGPPVNLDRLRKYYT
jgi:hypothetical protein